MTGTSKFEVRSKANGILKRLEKFDLLSGIVVGEHSFGITFSFSHNHLGKTLNASDHQKCI